MEKTTLHLWIQDRLRKNGKRFDHLRHEIDWLLVYANSQVEINIANGEGILPTNLTLQLVA